MPVETTSKRKKLLITGAILLLIVLLLSLLRCNDDKEETQVPETAGSPGTESVTDTIDTDTLHVEESDTVTENATVGHVRKKPRVTTKKKIKKDAVIEKATESSEKSQPAEEHKQPLAHNNKAPQQDAQPKAQQTYYKFPKKHEFRAGLRAGTGYSRILSLGGMFEDYSTRPRFSMKEKGSMVFRGGAYSTWQYGRLGAELGLDYMHQSSTMTKNGYTTGLRESTKFSSDMLAPQLMFRFYPLKDVYMSAGAALAIPFHSDISYSTNRTGTIYLQQDELTSKHMNQSIKSRAQLMPSLKIGYLHRKTGLEAAIEYNYGISDLYHTRANDYGFMERENRSHYIGLTLGYSIELNRDRHEDK